MHMQVQLCGRRFMRKQACAGGDVHARPGKGALAAYGYCARENSVGLTAHVRATGEHFVVVEGLLESQAGRGQTIQREERKTTYATWDRVALATVSCAPLTSSCSHDGGRNVYVFTYMLTTRQWCPWTTESRLAHMRGSAHRVRLSIMHNWG